MKKKALLITLCLVIPLAVFGLILVINAEMCNPWFIEGLGFCPSDNVSEVLPSPHPSTEGSSDNTTPQPTSDNGTPTVQTAGLIIYPPGLQVVLAYGTPALRYPQTISPSGLSVPIAYGTPSIVIMGEGVIYVPGHQQPIAYGVPSLLKYVWHAILDGRYSTGTLEVNRAYVIGRDANGNPVYGTAVDSTELGLVGERLDFQQELAIPTEAQAQEVANAILSKLGLTGKSGVILIPPNCGQELFDVVQVTDSRGNQSAAKYRVVGLRFEYNPKQARYHHKLILGGP